MAIDEHKLGDDDTATDPTSRPVEGCADSMATLLGSAGGGGMAGIADAMANCRRMFERGCRQPGAHAATDEEPMPTEATDSSRKEV